MNQAFRFAPQMIWVRSKSGSTYMCPAGALAKPEEASEAELRRYCIDESQNPQNN